MRIGHHRPLGHGRAPALLSITERRSLSFNYPVFVPRLGCAAMRFAWASPVFLSSLPRLPVFRNPFSFCILPFVLPYTPPVPPDAQQCA